MTLAGSRQRGAVHVTAVTSHPIPHQRCDGSICTLAIKPGWADTAPGRDDILRDLFPRESIADRRHRHHSDVSPPNRNPHA